MEQMEDESMKRKYWKHKRLPRVLQCLKLPKAATCIVAIIIYKTILFVVLKSQNMQELSLFTLKIARIPLHRKIIYRKVGVCSDKSNMFTFEFIEN